MRDAIVVQPMFESRLGTILEIHPLFRRILFWACPRKLPYGHASGPSRMSKLRASRATSFPACAVRDARWLSQKRMRRHALSTTPRSEAYPAVPDGPRCGMRALLSRCSRRRRRGAQWPRADRFRSFKRRFPTRRAAPPFCWGGVGRRVLFVPAVASNAPRR